MKHQCALSAGLVMLGLFAASSARAEIAVFTPSKDTTLYSETDVALSNGAGEYLFAGVTGPTAGGTARRALMAFDLSSIAPGSTITSVELRMAVASAALNAPGSPFTLFRVSADWGEAGSNAGSPGGGGAPALTGDATWTHRFFNTQTWAIAGGDFVDSASATSTVTAPVGGGALTISTWATTPELVADVQSWIDNPSTNYGWILRGLGGVGQTAARFASSEYSLDATLRPTLTVNYVPIPEPSSALLLLPGIAALGFIARRRIK